MASSTGLREVARQAARERIVDAAGALFARRGYDDTTVGDIAEQVGMSQRTFFRYFPTKEAVVLDAYDRRDADWAERLVARPAGEPEWTSLRRIFDAVIELSEDPQLWRRENELFRVVLNSPALLGAHLERRDKLQQQLAEILGRRRASRTSSEGADVLQMRALVGAAYACMDAAVQYAQARGPEHFTAYLDSLMDAMRPVSQPRA